MEIKILQVFYDKNGLPYKDKERAVHYPITSGTFLGASNTTQIRFYYDRLDELNESTFVAVSKLPNGKIGSEILESEYDSELQENYAVLNLSQFYTQYKGDVYISLQGYEGGVRVEQDENGVYSILGTPTIQATGSIRMYVAYAPTFIGSGQTENVTLQRVLAELSTKLGIRQEALHVEELPTVGNSNVWYVVNDDPNDPNKANIYIWNAKTQTYVWVGDNTLNLGDYYTKEEGDQFESDIDNRVSSVENELSSVASGSPKGVYATLEDLQTAYPTGTTGIFVTSDTGYWYYWNGSAWTYGGVYQAAVNENSYENFEDINVYEKDNLGSNLSVEIGVIGSNGSKQTSTNRIRTKALLHAPFSVAVNSGYTIRNVYKYNYDGSFVSYSSVSSNSYSTNDKTYLYALVFNKIDESDVSASDLTNLISVFTSALQNKFNEIIDSNSKTEKNVDYLLSQSENVLPLEVGTLTSIGDNADAQNRARTVGYFKAPIELKANSGWILRTLHKYTKNANGEYIFNSYQSLGATQVVLNDTSYVYRLVINKSTEATIVPSDLTSVFSAMITQFKVINDGKIDLEYGAIDSGRIDNSSAYYNKRARTKDYIAAPFNIQMNNGYLIRKIYKYTYINGVLTYVGELSVTSVPYIAINDTNYIYKFTVNKTNDTQDISDLDDVIDYSNVGSANIIEKIEKDISINALRKIAQVNNDVSAHFAGNLLAEYGTPSGSGTFTYPEFSQFNILLAKMAGFNMLGINIQMTQDGVLVCCHDFTINRTMRPKNDYDTTIAETVTISQTTYQNLIDNYVCNSSIERLRLPILKFEDAIKTCKAINMGIFIITPPSSEASIAAIDLMNKYGLKDYGFVSTERLAGSDALFIVPSSTTTKKTKSQIVEILENIGKPAGYMFYNVLNLYTDEELIDIANTLHNKGYLVSCSLYEGKDEIARLKEIGSFDFSNVDNDIPEFINGNYKTIKSVADFSGFTCQGTNALYGKLNNGDKISYENNETLFLSGACMHIHFEGTIKLTFGNGYSNTEITSNGSGILVFTNVFSNEKPNFTIEAVGSTNIYDITFDINKYL